jgi:tetratricopeptide (TPR) repeat protein
MSPSNFFRHESKPVANPTPLPTFSSSPDSPGQMASLSTNPEVVSKTAASPGRTLPVARYTYVSPPKPAAGDRKEAEKLYSQGVQAQSDRGAKEAMTFYRAATQADPSFFEAQLNLGFAAFEAGDTSQSLLAYETALAAKPDSFIGRFNFALALQKAGYIQDSAQELERLLAGSPPDETVQHLALAHLTLANLYADRFHQPAFARPHYLKVLDLDPHNSQATVIRYWLSENH